MQRPRYNVVVPTELGAMIINRHDTGVGHQLAATGTYEPDEMALFETFVQSLRRDDPVVLDIGANIGTHALRLAGLIGARGAVHAFEAQRIVFHMLCGNVALNSVENVWCHHLALGAEPGLLAIPQFDYDRPLSFGSIEFGAEQREPIGQQRGDDPTRVEYVRMDTVDQLDFPAVHLMKIDVEGMELAVLQGARDTIARDRPLIFLEYLKGDRRELAAWLLRHSYRVFPHRHNWLCLPPGSPLQPHGSAEITDPAHA
ncbi:MAG: FkbM family methyltransferase [Planctomycetota bacterium]